MFKIHWNSNFTSGNGSPVTYSIGKEWVKLMNKKYPEIKHYLKSV